MKDALNKEFMKSKSKDQCVTEIKEIKKKVNESAWDIDQWLKCLLSQVNLQISDEQHDLYIALLLSHLRLPLSQQKIGSQAEALEIVMKLEASPI